MVLFRDPQMPMSFMIWARSRTGITPFLLNGVYDLGFRVFPLWVLNLGFRKALDLVLRFMRNGHRNPRPWHALRAPPAWVWDLGFGVRGFGFGV